MAVEELAARFDVMPQTIRKASTISAASGAGPPPTLLEREVLLALAPHIIWPLRFVLPHHAGLRPWPVIRLGLFLYDHLGGRRILPPTRSLDLRHDEAGRPLKPVYHRDGERLPRDPRQP